MTGSLWAHSAWGTWWTWDPRLTSAFVLWMIYSGCLILRAQLDGPHGRARLSAVLAILGALDIPLVVVAARWFRGIHPPGAAMDPVMHAVLGWSTAGFTALFFLLLGCRWRQLRRQALVELRAEQIVQPGLPDNNPLVATCTRNGP